MAQPDSGIPRLAYVIISCIYRAILHIFYQPVPVVMPYTRPVAMLYISPAASDIGLRADTVRSYDKHVYEVEHSQHSHGILCKVYMSTTF